MIDYENKKLPLVEKFGPTIQGEGAVIGAQTYFLRFGLCDFKCTMCDSLHAVIPGKVKDIADFLTQEEIVDKFLKELYIPGSAKHVTLSGGNPCIHNLTILAGTLRKLGFKIAVETQGTLSPDWLANVNTITVSPKGPGMGQPSAMRELDKFMNRALELNPEALNIKVVAFDQRDLEFASMVYERFHHRQPEMPFFLSLGNPLPPAPNKVAEAQLETLTQEQHMAELLSRYRNLFEDIKKDPILCNFRWLPQWHVFVWGNARGR